MTCSDTVGYQRFGGPRCHHLQGKLKMGVAWSSETLVSYNDLTESWLWCRSLRLKKVNQELPTVLFHKFVSYFIKISVGIAIGVLGFDSRQGLWIFMSTTASITALEPIQTPIQWVPGALPSEIKRLTTHLHLLPKSKNAWGYTSTPPICLHGVVLSLKKTQGQLYKLQTVENIFVQLAQSTRI
jgi:hypothetical protein